MQSFPGMKLQISVWRRVAADISGLQAGNHLYTIGLARFVTPMKTQFLFCILHFAFCISWDSTINPNLFEKHGLKILQSRGNCAIFLRLREILFGKKELLYGIPEKYS
jgi:hypothetical protein